MHGRNMSDYILGGEENRLFGGHATADGRTLVGSRAVLVLWNLVS